MVHPSDVAAVEGRYPAPFDAEGLGFGRNLGVAAGSRTLGVWHDRLPPGRRSSRPHAHLREEELVYVVEGAPVLRWWAPGHAREEAPLRAGHLVAFPAGTGIAHCFHNPGPGDAVLLVVGERRPSERIAFPEDAELEMWRQSNGSLRRWTDRLGSTGDGTRPATRVETERVVLTPVGPDDVLDQIGVIRRNHARLKEWMAFAVNVPSIDRQLLWAASARIQFLRGEDYNFAVRRRDGALIGGAGLHPRGLPGVLDIGYWIDGEHEGQGYVTEWCAALCRVATEVLGARRVTIHHDEANTRSAGVPQRLGFVREGVMRGLSMKPEGGVRHAVLWAWLPSDASERIASSTVRAWDAVGRRLL